MVANDGTQMTPCPCVWFKFAFYPFFAHEGNRVLLLEFFWTNPSTISPSHATNEFETLHNDLSQDNIMLHFSSDNLSIVYIGVCD
jgi:hypothetical protein